MSDHKIVIDLKVPALAKYGGVVRDTVYSIALRSGLTMEDCEDIRVAVGEAFTNALQYAYEGEAHSQFVDVKCITETDKFEIILKDYGRGFTSDNKPPSNDIGIGLGITFMQSLMDEVHIESSIGAGTNIRMVKNINP